MSAARSIPLTITQLHLAEFLLERGSRPEALELLADAVGGFRALGLDRFVARAEQMRASAGPV